MKLPLFLRIAFLKLWKPSFGVNVNANNNAFLIILQRNGNGSDETCGI